MTNRVRNPFRSRVLIALAAISVCLAIGSVPARQFRQLNPIATPRSETANLPAGAVALQPPRPLTAREVTPLVREVLSKWNTADMADTLANSFFDNSRLVDAVDTGVPRDATLRVQSIQGIQTLQQYAVPGEGGERGDIVSVVSATVTTQLEFNSSTDGFVRRQGTNEFILEIRMAAPPEVQ